MPASSVPPVRVALSWDIFAQLIYLMQDAVSPDVQRILGFNIKR